MHTCMSIFCPPVSSCTTTSHSRKKRAEVQQQDEIKDGTDKGYEYGLRFWGEGGCSITKMGM